MIFGVNGAAIFTWLPRLPDLQTKLDIDVPTLAWIAFAASAGGLIGSQLAPWAMRRFGTTVTVAVGGISALAALSIASITPVTIVVGLALGAAGLGDGAQDVGMNAAGVSHQTMIGRPILQRLHGAWSVGALAGAVIATAAAAFRIPLAVHIVTVNVVLFALTVWALRLLPTGTPPERRSTMLARLAVEPSMRRSVIIIGLAVALVAIAEGIASEWPPVLLANDRGTGPGAASAATTVLLAAMSVARLTGDHLIVRHGTRRVLLAGMVATVVGSAIAFGVAAPAATYVGVALMGAGGAYAFPALFTIAGTDPNIGPGDGAALVSGVARIGFLAYPPLIAWLEPTIGLGPALQAATLAGIGVVLLVWFGMRNVDGYTTTAENPAPDGLTS